MIEITKREAATVSAALEYWKEELREAADCVAENLFFAKYSPLTVQEVDALSDRLQSTSDRMPSEMRLMVPTYNYQLYPKYVETKQKPEFSPPETPVVIREASGIRIVLGTHNYDDVHKPDVQIERHPNGWMIFLHPLGGCDASGYVYFVDDGRSYLLKEFGCGPTQAIRVFEAGQKLPEFDGK